MRPNVTANGTILLIDDDGDVREAIALFLRKRGFNVRTADHGLDALRKLQQEGLPSVIIVDLMMPIMDGWEFMKRQRRDWRLCTIPTIVISGVPSHDPRCLEMPIVRLLPKPYTLDQLMAAIEAECSPPRARTTA
jgi:CheY-like chemotaxis protein